MNSIHRVSPGHFEVGFCGLGLCTPSMQISTVSSEAPQHQAVWDSREGHTRLHCFRLTRVCGLELHASTAVPSELAERSLYKHIQQSKKQPNMECSLHWASEIAEGVNLFFLCVLC